MKNLPGKSQTIQFLIAAIVFLSIILIPEILAGAAPPEGYIYNGALINIDDLNVYLSAIRQGSEGDWLFTSQFTPEAQPAIFSYFPYLMIGKLFYLFGGSLVGWYQALRISGLIFCLFLLAKLSKTIFPDQPKSQITAYILLLFGSGISWLVISSADQIPSYAADLLTPEWNLLTSSFSAPHFLIGFGCQAAIFSELINLLNQPNLKSTARLFLFSSFLSLSYPFIIPVDGLVIAIYFVFDILNHKKIPWNKIGYIFIGTLPMVFFLGYYGLYILSNPGLKNTLVSNNLIDPPSLFGVMIGFGLLIILTGFGLKDFAKGRTNRLFLIWIATNLVCLYLPFSFSGRFVLGLFIPFGLLSAKGIERIVEKITARSKHSNRTISPILLRRVLILLTIPSTLLLLVWTISGPRTNPGYPYYIAENEIAALNWLSGQAEGGDLIFADYPVSNLAPRYMDARVFLGHLNLTLNLNDKLAMQNDFWNQNTDQNWKSEFIKKWGITYIYYGATEQRRSADVDQIPGILVYNQDGIRIYQSGP